MRDQDLEELDVLKEAVSAFFVATGMGLGNDWEKAFRNVRADDDLASSFLSELRRLIYFIEGLAVEARERREQTPTGAAEPARPTSDPDPPVAPTIDPFRDEIDAAFDSFELDAYEADPDEADDGFDGPRTPRPSDEEKTVIRRVSEITLADARRPSVAGPLRVPATMRKFIDATATTIGKPPTEELPLPATRAAKPPVPSGATGTSAKITGGDGRPAVPVPPAAPATRPPRRPPPK